MLKFHALTVREVEADAEDAVRVSLDVPQRLREEFRTAAGQHVVLRAKLGDEELRRTYSVTDAAGSVPLTLGIRVHAQGRLSRYLAKSLKVGDQVEVMPPNGSFGAALNVPAMPSAGATYVAFASGCGITPVLSIVRTLLEHEPAAQVMLFYGNRHSARTMFLEDLQALKDCYPARFALHFVMSDEPQDVDLFNGRIDSAKVAAMAATLFDAKSVRACFVCGPGTMIQDVTVALQSLGVDAARIHAEHFAIDTATTPVAAATPVARSAEVAAGMADVTVVMDGRRRSFAMPMSGETLLDAAAKAGIDLPYSCRAGVCSTCRTRLARGQVEMAQNYALEEWELERGFILACQAHPTTSDIELDYDER